MTKRKDRFEIIALSDEISRACKKSLGKVPAPNSEFIFLHSGWPAPSTLRGTSIFVHWADSVDDEYVTHFKKYRRRVNKLLLLNRWLSSDAVFHSLLDLMVRKWERFYVADDTDQDQTQKLLWRLFLGLGSEEGKTILNATIEGDCLNVVSSDFDKLVVPFSKLKELLRSSDDRLRNIEIDEDGSFVFWPELDVHMGWEQFHQLLDPPTALRAKQRSGEFNHRYGRAIRSLRESKGLRQTDIEGLTARQVSRIENGESRATPSTIQKFAKAHGLTPSRFMAAVAGLL